MQASSPSQQLAALAVVLEHPVITSDPLLLCCAARVCRAWRAAVAGAGAGTTAVVINNHKKHPQRKPQEFADALLSKVSSFAAWLRKHASAVRSISLSCSLGDSQPALNSAGQLLALALQLAAAGRKLLPLKHFDSTFATSEVLAALPAGLTTLSLGGPVPHNLAFSSTGALTAALHRMTGLRALSLDMPDEALGDEVTLKPMGSLTHLTRLLLRLAGLKRVGTWFDLREALTGLPALQDLCCDLRFQQPDDRAMVACMGGPQLSAMTALTRLELSVAPILPGPGGWLAMPPHVQELSVSLTDPGWQLSGDEQEVSVIKPVPAMQLAGLQHLRRLTLRCCQGHSLAGLPGSGDVLQQLTRLEAVDLHYSTLQAAAQDAGLWKSLPGLAGLCVSDPRAGDLATLLAWQRLVLLSLPSLYGLTRLELLLYDSQSAERALSVGTTLSGLTKLKQLTIDMAWQSSKLCHRDCLALTHLRALTSLVLRGVQDAVDDTVAVALACNLTQLRHLDLSGSAMRSDTPMPALASLRHLTQITLPRSEYSYRNDNRELLQWQRRGAGLPELIVLQ